MRTMKNAVEELVIELDAGWMAETRGHYTYAEAAAEPGALAWLSGVEEGTSMEDLRKAAPLAWQEVSGSDGGRVWFRGVKQEGPALLIQVSRANPETQGYLLVELDEALAA